MWEIASGAGPWICIAVLRDLVQIPLDHAADPPEPRRAHALALLAGTVLTGSGGQRVYRPLAQLRDPWLRTGSLVSDLNWHVVPGTEGYHLQVARAEQELRAVVGKLLDKSGA